MKKRIIIGAGCLLCIIYSYSQKLPVIQSTFFKKDTINISRLGAVNDGKTLNTSVINKAIEDCNKKGGGVVHIPAGVWLTGPVILKSNVNLYLAENALLLFTDDFNEYKLIETNWEGLAAVRNESPISATNAQNIAITGKGIIDGNGDAWRMVKKEKFTETQWKKKLASGGVLSEDKKTWYPTASSLKGSVTNKPGVLASGSLEDYKPIKDFLRPNLLVFAKCDRVLLEGITFQNSPAWCLHPLMSSNITVRNIFVKNPWYAQNGDGIDLESCRNVLVENSVFDVGDDGICIKSGRDAEGRKRAMPTQDVIIRNCTVYHAHGGFVIGSEMSGGANNIHVTDCTFIGTDIGLRFKTTRGRGGVVENIFIKNIGMTEIIGEAILFDMYYAAKDPIVLAGEKREAPKVEFKPVTEETPQFKNFVIENVVCRGAEKAIFIRGLPEMNIHDIRMENISMISDKGIQVSEAKNISFSNINLITKEPTPVVDVLNSSNISFNKVSIKDPSVVLRIGGERSKDIKWINSTPMENRVVFEFGAKQSELKKL